MRGSRREFLASAGLAAAGTSAFAGCTGGLAGDTVEVLAAGSLQRAFDETLRDAVDANVALEARGSAAAARLVADGKRDPDVLALADTALFDHVLDGAWYAAFATNALCVAAADSHGGRRVASAAGGDAASGDDSHEHWFDPVLDGDAALGRTDPDLDPLGYRTLFALELAERHYDRKGLRDALLGADQVYPETALLSGLETGALDAAVVYENMAVERGYDHVDLPPEVDLSDPRRADRYREATYRLPGGATVRGGVVEYGVTLRSTDDPAARRAFDAVTGGDALAGHGFGVPDRFPAYSANAPEAVRGR